LNLCSSLKGTMSTDIWYNLHI